MAGPTPTASNFIDRMSNPFFGAFQASNIVEGRIEEVHSDENQNVTLAATVVGLHGEKKIRIPFLFPYANAIGTAGIFAIPNVGDRCLIGLIGGNLGYVLGYHPAAQTSPGRASSSVSLSEQTGETGQSLKGTFATLQLVPGAMEMRSQFGNRVMVHPGGSIAVEARTDVFTFYDAVKATIRSQTRSLRLFTAGGFVKWQEAAETTKRSMAFDVEMFTKSATAENLALQDTNRGGAKLNLSFSEAANNFFLTVTSDTGVTNRIQMGPNGVIIDSSENGTQGSITISPDGSFSFTGGDPAGLNTKLLIGPESIAMSAFISNIPVALVEANTDGEVNVSSTQEVNLNSTRVSTIGQTFLGALGGLGSAAILDSVVVLGVESGPTSAQGFITTGSSQVSVAP